MEERAGGWEERRNSQEGEFLAKAQSGEVRKAGETCLSNLRQGAEQCDFPAF